MALRGIVANLGDTMKLGAKLNLGCGRDIRQGWINLDCVGGPGVDLVADLEAGEIRLPDSSISEIHGAHVIEHLRDPLPMMAELWRVAAPDCVAEFRCPYGSSDDADEDPTHVRRMFLGSWYYFGQPVYWRADYGYRGDWQAERVELRLKPEFAEVPDEDLPALVRYSRNVVGEMVARLRAVKPARQPLRELLTPPSVVYVRQTANGATRAQS